MERTITVVRLRLRQHAQTNSWTNPGDPINSFIIVNQEYTFAVWRECFVNDDLLSICLLLIILQL